MGLKQELGVKPNVYIFFSNTKVKRKERIRARKQESVAILKHSSL